eukprot:233661-Rhodomonas_salina.1
MTSPARKYSSRITKTWERDGGQRRQHQTAVTRTVGARRIRFTSCVVEVEAESARSGVQFTLWKLKTRSSSHTLPKYWSSTCRSAAGSEYQSRSKISH